jgi:hypothetical protein
MTDRAHPDVTRALAYPKVVVTDPVLLYHTPIEPDDMPVPTTHEKRSTVALSAIGTLIVMAGYFGFLRYIQVAHGHDDATAGHALSAGVRSLQDDVIVYGGIALLLFAALGALWLVGSRSPAQ